jgi:hypothetical protein
MERERGLVLRRDGATRTIDAMTSRLDFAYSQWLCLRDAFTLVFTCCGLLHWARLSDLKMHFHDTDTRRMDAVCRKYLIPQITSVQRS